MARLETASRYVSGIERTRAKDIALGIAPDSVRRARHHLGQSSGLTGRAGSNPGPSRYQTSGG